MQEQSGDTPPVAWARNTGPDVPQGSRRLLIYLAENCHPETGVISVSYRKIAAHLRLSSRWAYMNVAELRLAGLLQGGDTGSGDRRVNTYTLAGADSGWAVATPFVPYNRHEYYRLHRRVAELEGVLQAASPGTVPGGGRCKPAEPRGRRTRNIPAQLPAGPSRD